jgi:lipopolysaccharide transport system ATP-binding protein
MSTVIKIENLYKEYRLGVISHDTLYRDLQSWWAKIRGMEDPNSLIGGYAKNDLFAENILAINNINLEVKDGEVLGIIGRNGAGKSTLLKILSRVTAPTKGCIKVLGRVASLLEVSTGFHSELTGRENIYLNGAINGMNRKEVSRKLDEIVDFSGVEQFLDTPVKRYSSGMHVRLGFSVAAHLEPEILVVDEVLAVGDADFQKKCLGKMGKVAKEGRTVLFVSHNMSSIESLCSRAVQIEAGEIVYDHNPKNTISNYFSQTKKIIREIPLDQRKDRAGSGKVRAVSFEVLDVSGKNVTFLKSGEDYSFRVGYLNKTNNEMKNVIACIDILDEKGNRLLLFRSNFTNNKLSISSTSGFLLCEIKNLPLALGTYHAVFFLSRDDVEVLDAIENISELKVEGGDYFGTGSFGLPGACKILKMANWLND